MRFSNEMQLALPADEVFAALKDVEGVASCLPGARVEGRDGDAYRGAMRIKVGPIVADYRGTLMFEELDVRERRTVLVARGEETVGQGSAQARIASSVQEEAGGARVLIETDLQVSGRVAQFGSGAMEKIAKKMFVDFARNLERSMTSGGREPGGAPAGGDGASPSAGSPEADESRPVPDALDVVGLVAEPLRRAIRGAALPAVAAFVVGYLVGRSRSSS